MFHYNRLRERFQQRERTQSATDCKNLLISRLFDRFFTVEAARSSTGLGLSIARTLTEQLGGSIRAAYDGGTLQIIVRFPQ